MTSEPRRLFYVLSTRSLPALPNAPEGLLKGISFRDRAHSWKEWQNSWQRDVSYKATYEMANRLVWEDKT
jgi:hypothetical protein